MISPSILLYVPLLLSAATRMVVWANEAIASNANNSGLSKRIGFIFASPFHFHSIGNFFFFFLLT
jgi:hypothetical protein